MERIRICRERLGLSQKQVAIEIGVRPPTVSQWESGIKTPSRENLAKLADLYGVSIEYLMDKSDDEGQREGIELARDERMLIANYRSLNEQGKEYIRQTMFMARTIYKKCSDVSGVENKVNS